MASTYTYGTTLIHDGYNFFLLQKEFGFPQFKQSLYPIARNVGVKKTGERQDEVMIPCTIKVISQVGTRADLEGLLDTLFGGLQLRQQQLTLHTEDNRYWVADAITGKVQFSSGQIVSATVPVVFVALQPFAYAQATTVDSFGNLTLLYGGAGTGWQSMNGAISTPSSGNAPSGPTLALTNNSPANTSHLTAGLTSSTNYTSLSVAAMSYAMGLGAVIQLNDGSGHTQNVTLSAASSVGATTLSVVSFTANFSYPVTTTAVNPPTTITQMTIAQLLDGISLIVGPMSLAIGQTLTIPCDFTIANGGTCTIGGGNPLPYTGIFPVVEPPLIGTTTWQLTVPAALSQPIINTQISWIPRWVS